MNSINLMFSVFAVSLVFSILGQSGSCRNRETSMNSAPVEKKVRLANGVWGGQHIRMEVTDNGAQIEYDCAHSTIDEAIVLNRSGRFDVKGKFTAQHGGPIRRDEEPRSSPVRYVGEANAKTIALTITNTETRETLGSFTLTRGSEGRLMKCR
jgi:hypothetical protein